jgi:hypothetical protein
MVWVHGDLHDAVTGIAIMILQLQRFQTHLVQWQYQELPNPFQATE